MMGLPLYEKIISIVKNGKLYTLTFTAPKQRYEEINEAQFELILDTLEIW